MTAAAIARHHQLLETGKVDTWNSTHLGLVFLLIAWGGSVWRVADAECDTGALILQGNVYGFTKVEAGP